MARPKRAQVSPAKSLIGAFVTVDHDDFSRDSTPLAPARLGADGIGRLVDIKGTTATVEYFVSPAGPDYEKKAVDLSKVRRVVPWPETPVFWFDERTGTWRRGRITAPEGEATQPSQERYRVRFPNGQDGLIPGSELQVRWAHPIDDPVEYLAARVTDTP